MIFRKIAEFFRFSKRKVDDKKITIKKRKIRHILPHRGRMLLLDEVMITPEKVIGKFKVTKKVCKGHAVFGGNLVFKGSDILDMSAQLLGVWAAHLLTIKKDALVRVYGGVSYGWSRFKKPIYPGETLNIEINTHDISSEILKGGKIMVVRGKNFSAQVNGEIRAEVKSVELVAPETDNQF